MPHQRKHAEQFTLPCAFSEWQNHILSFHRTRHTLYKALLQRKEYNDRRKR